MESTFVISARYRARVPLDQKHNFSLKADDSALNLLEQIEVSRKSSNFPIEAHDFGFLSYQQPHFLKNSGAVYLGDSFVHRQKLSKRATFFTNYDSIVRVMKQFEKKSSESISVFFNEIDPSNVKLARYARARGIKLPLIAHVQSTTSVFSLNRLVKDFNQVLIHFDQQNEYPFPKFLKSLTEQGAPIGFFLKNLSVEDLEAFIVNHQLYDQSFPIIYARPDLPGLKTEPKEIRKKIESLARFHQTPIWIV